MDYKHIENLVLLCKANNEEAKETLVSEFNPFIINLCKKSFVSGYEFEDIKNECYGTLFKCINLYDPEKHRFVAYSTNAMKNSINCLIRKSVRRQLTDGSKVIVLNTEMESILSSDINFVEDIIYKNQVNSKVRDIIKNLTSGEKELIYYIYYKGYSMKRYSDLKKKSYYSVVSIKMNVLSKLKLQLKGDSCFYYKN
jgi:RNA polymerase sigma factor (sigma-70 family)